ncbi:MAG: thymidylate synthase [Gammaproteobacteria bacterium]|nr:MAG: thymidylate synthase [Gammaproteobacteria bacterium]PHR80814.1 MAG: thymidylate synthase [Colwellia sp.]
MHIVKGKTLNEVVFQLLELLTTSGHKTPSRNGDVLSLYDVSIIIENPRSRHLNLIGRTNNIFATFAETFWVLAGQKNIHPYLSFFLPRARLYSDDGLSWRAAYGERLYAYNQLENVIDIFKEEGIYTRRAVISLYMPNKDTKTSLKQIHNVSATKDIPCNNLIHFFVTPDKKLNIKVIQRSGDVIFGVSNINIFEFGLLHELILNILKLEVDSELELGYHNQSVTNLHLYDSTSKQAYDVLENEQKQELSNTNYDTISFPNSINANKKLFTSLIDKFSELITDEKYTYNDAKGTLQHIFEELNVPVKGNLLWGYTVAILSFVFQEKYGKKIEVDKEHFCSEFTDSIANNFFNRYQIKEK